MNKIKVDCESFSAKSKKPNWTNMCSLFKEIMYNSFSQAIINLIQSQIKMQKLFLACCILGSSCFASYLVFESISDYFEYEVITTTRSIFEVPTQFPKIKICNVNPFATKYSFDFLKNIEKELNPFNASLLENPNIDSHQKIDLINRIKALALKKMNSESFSEDRQKLGHTIEEILFSCTFNFEECDSKDFVWKFDNIYGNCFEFNSTSNKVFYPGRLGGLKLSLYVNIYENLKFFTNEIGGIVRIENGSYLTDYYGGVKIAGGFQTDIVVDRFFKKSIKKPYSNCELNADESPDFFGNNIQRLIAEQNYRYSQSLCLSQTFQKNSINKCNCSYPYVLSLHDYEECTSMEQLNCSISVLLNYNNLENDTDNYCPLECDLIEFKIYISMLQLIGERFVNNINEKKNLTIDFLGKPITSDMARQSTSEIYVYYESLSYTQNTESPKIPIELLIASIGGNLSLILGISLFSIFEVIILMFEIYFIKKSRN